MAQKGRILYDLSPRRELTFTDAWETFRDEMDFMELQREAKLQQVANEMKCRMSLYGSQLKNLTTRADKTEEILDIHQQGLDRQVDVNNVLFKEVTELKEARLASIASDGESIKKLISISARLALLEQNRQQLIADRDDIAEDSGSRRRGPMGSGPKGKRSPCPFCGKELSVKYLRRGDHQKKHCKKAPTAAAPAMEDKEPEAVIVISDLQTVNGTSRSCSEEIPGDLQFQ